VTYITIISLDIHHKKNIASHINMAIRRRQEPYNALVSSKGTCRRCWFQQCKCKSYFQGTAGVSLVLILALLLLVLVPLAASSPSSTTYTSSTTTEKEETEPNVEKKVALVTLVTTSTYIPGALVLAESLKHVNAKGDRILLWVGPEEDPRSDLTKDHLTQLNSYWDQVIQLSKANGTYTECRISAEQKAITDENPALIGMDRYWGTCSKFAVWTLTNYDVVVYMDADSIAMNNFDFVVDEIDDEYSFAAHGVPTCWDKDPPEWVLFYTALMVIKPLPNVQSYLHYLASKQYLATGEIFLLNQVIEHWKPLPRFTLVAQTEAARPIDAATGEIDWSQVKVYDFAGSPESKPWNSHALSKQYNDPNWHGYFGSMIPGMKGYQRYMIPQLLWNQYYDQILEREQVKQKRKSPNSNEEL
jgi:hypothetical protein